MLLKYNELPESVQWRAIEGMKCMNRHFLVLAKEKAFQARQAKTLDGRINSPFCRLIWWRAVKLAQTVQQDKQRTTAEWERLITGNLIEFDEQGRAYSYVFKKFF